MNPERVENAKKIAGTIKRAITSAKKTDTVLCPPYIYLSSLSSLSGKNIFLGSQDAFYETHGSFTGEVSFNQLYQFGVRFVIIGHSERRARGESDGLVNKKVRAVVGGGMTAIVCVGEKERDTHGDYLHTVKQQVAEGLLDVSKKSLDNIVIAYEPVWAIGAQNAMRTQEIAEMAIYIRKVLRDIYGVLSDGIRILYGGSVNALNAGEIVRDGFIQGLLVGRESLKPKEFVEIIKIVDSI